MIIEQHIEAPSGYVAARVILFRGPFETDEVEQEKPRRASCEPNFADFKRAIRGIRGKFISTDVPGFTVKRASGYLTRAAAKGLVRKTGEKRNLGYKPFYVYEVCHD